MLRFELKHHSHLPSRRPACKCVVAKTTCSDASFRRPHATVTLSWTCKRLSKHAKNAALPPPAQLLLCSGPVVPAILPSIAQALHMALGVRQAIGLSPAFLSLVCWVGTLLHRRLLVLRLPLRGQLTLWWQLSLGWPLLVLLRRGAASWHLTWRNLAWRHLSRRHLPRRHLSRWHLVLLRWRAAQRHLVLRLLACSA